MFIVTYIEELGEATKEFSNATDLKEFVASCDTITSIKSNQKSESLSIDTSINRIDKLKNESIEELTPKVINEVKRYDKPHGQKLSHKLLDQFFRDVAPKFQTLGAVENALANLYKQNNIEYSVQGIKQVVSTYRKHVEIAKKAKKA